MGSASDYEVMSGAIKTLEEFGIECEKRVISAHRAPDALAEWSKTAKERGLKVIIAGAGGADCRHDDPPGDRHSGALEGPERHGLAALDRADALGYSGGYDGHRRREECGSVCRCDVGPLERGAGCEARRLPSEADRGCAEGGDLIPLIRRI